jgi:tight adherence protein B
VLLPILVFIGVVAIVFGGYWAVVLRPEQVKETRVRKRLVQPKRAGAATIDLVKELQRLSSVPALNTLLQGRGDVVSPLRKLIEQAGVKVTVGAVLLSSALLAAIGLLAGRLSIGSVWLGLLIGAVLAWIPFGVLQLMRNKRTAKFEELFPEAIDLLSRALRAGHAFTTALGMVAEELPQPISGEFRLLYDRQNYGLPLNEALRDFGERIPLLDARFFVTAVLTQRESGGNLSEVLDNLAKVIRDRFTVKRQVQVKSAHGRITGWVLAGMPPALVLIFLVVSPGYLRPLIEEPAGNRMVVFGLGLQVVGTFIIRRIVRIDY